MATQPVRVTYVWCSGKDSHHDLRSKDKTVYLTGEQAGAAPQELLDAGVFPEWNFDGSSTEQAKGVDTEILVRPVRAYKNVLPSYAADIKRFVVLCECYLPNGQPTADNFRYVARQVFAEDKSNSKPWFGMEQEMVLVDVQRSWPVGWPSFGFPPPQGPYYCGNGAKAALGRRHHDKFYELALSMGLKISGTNAEVLPSQWEFQVGPCEGIDAGDQLIMARWLYVRLMEDDGIDVDFRAKPFPQGDWNGSGLHTNFSTEATRAEGGIQAIYEYIDRLSKTVVGDIPFYGPENHLRLTGAHETSRIDEFGFGVGTRGTSIRIPNQVNNEKKGYFEDRRPAADADPYLVSARLFASSLGLEGKALASLAPRLRQKWMPSA